MKSNGLTLIELLLALTIFAIVAVAIYAVFSTGIISWRKGESAISLFREIRLGFDMISREIRNQTSYNGSKLIGQADELYFTSLIPFPEEGKREYYRLARIRYFLEDEGEDKVTLWREREWTPSLEGAMEGTEGSSEIDKMRLFQHIKSFDFQYGRKEMEEEKIILNWQTDWEDKEKALLAIKINLELKINGESKNLNKVIYLPQGEEL